MRFSYGKYSPESDSCSVSARSPMVSSVSKMASGYARSLGGTLIWMSTYHMTLASLIFIPKNTVKTKRKKDVTVVIFGKLVDHRLIKLFPLISLSLKIFAE